MKLVLRKTYATWITATLLSAGVAAPARLEAKPVSLTVSNYASTALALFDQTAWQWVDPSFGFNPDAPRVGVAQTFTLDDLHTYALVPYLRPPETGGHPFSFAYWADSHLVPWTPTSGFFQIDTSNNTIVVRGVPVTFHLVTPAAGQPGYELFCLNSGCLNGGADFAVLGGPDFVAYLPAADRSFDGVYDNVQTLTSGSSLGTLRLGTKFDILDWSAAGQSYVRTGPRRVRVTTDRGEVFEVTAGPVFFEAEDMTTDPSWGMVPHFEGWYYGSPSRGKMLSGNYWAWGGGSGPGAARQTVAINEAGVHRIWVRHFYYTAYRGPFNVAVYQNGVLAGAQDFDVVADDSLTFHQFIWRSFDVVLTPGPAEIVLTKGTPVDTSWVTRYVDCVVVAGDLAYAPDVMDFADPLYLKVGIGGSQTRPAVIHLWGSYSRPQPLDGTIYYYLPGCNIWEDGLHLWEYYTGYQSNPTNPNFLTAGESSPWLNIAPLVSYIGKNHLQYYAMQEYNTGLPASDFTLSLSTTPDEAGVFRSFSRSGTGSGLFVDIDLLNHDQTKSDIEYSQEAAAAAAGLPAVPGKRPTKFPLITGNAIGSTFCQPSTVNNEIQTLVAMGLNSRGYESGYDPVWYDQGFTKLFWANTDFWRLLNNDLSTPDYAAVSNAVLAAAQAAISTGKVNEVVAWLFMDEPGSMSLASISASTNCQARFRAYLQGLGLSPAFFGAGSWNEVVPTTSQTNGRLYYYSVLFRCRLLTDFFLLGTTILTSTIPTAPTTANFGEDATFYGNVLFSGTDWFDMLARGALRLGWTEDWLAYTVSYQVGGYRADLLRGACRAGNRPFGMYNIIIGRTPWDVQAKTVAAIGHGAQQIYHYNYGPSYAGGDSCSQDYTLYPALRQVNHAVGAVEDYLVGATVAPARIAVLYPRATDVWTMDDVYSVFGKDRMGLHLLLRHLGYPVDFLSEDDVAAGRLADYQLLICDGSHLEAAALAPLVNWVKGGGVLYLGAGALSCDQFNSPLGFDAQVGLQRAPFVYENNPGREMWEFPSLPNLMPVSFNGTNLEVVCGYQKLTSTAGVSRVLATFSGDASPAACLKSVGSGQVIFCGFFPGLAYQKAGMITKLARDAANPTPATYGSTDFPVAYRSFLAALLDPLPAAPPVGTGSYLVEANRLESAAGSVIALVNWTGAPLSNVPVSFARGTRQGRPVTVVNPVRGLVEQAGTVTVTLDLAGPIEFIVLPESSPLTVTITSPADNAVIGGNSVGLQATANVSGGTVTRVEFYNGGTLLGTDTTAPYSYAWSPVAPGSYALGARAYDNNGAVATSGVVNIRVDAPPTVTISAPANNAVIVGSSVTINATAADPDGTLAKVEFYNGATLLGTDPSSPYSYAWTAVSAGSYALTARAYDNNGAVATSAVVNVTVWSTVDVGAVGLAGSAGWTGGTFTVSGAGAGIAGTADACRFVYRSLTGDCTLIARIASVASGKNKSQAGVMIRQSTGATAVAASSLFKPQSPTQVLLTWRAVAGRTTSSTSSTASSAPYWVKVTRAGNTLRASKSANGTTWTQVGANTTVTMANPVVVGLAVTSGSTSSRVTATFDNVSLTQP